ncbi:MAG: acyl carrier protein [Kineothrix sp.]|nr:acyl carrier protein [Kineothrix sp.]
MTTEQKIALLEETLEVDEGTLKLEMELAEIDEYDSMSKLGIIVMMEDEFGVKLTGDNFKQFKTVGDIVNMMNN